MRAAKWIYNLKAPAIIKRLVICTQCQWSSLVDRGTHLATWVLPRNRMIEGKDWLPEVLLYPHIDTVAYTCMCTHIKNECFTCVMYMYNGIHIWVSASALGNTHMQWNFIWVLSSSIHPISSLCHCLQWAAQHRSLKLLPLAGKFSNIRVFPSSAKTFTSHCD